MTADTPIADEPRAKVTPVVTLTPREQRLQKAGSILRWGATINSVFTLLVLIVAILAAATSAEMFSTGADLTLALYGGASDTALLVVILLLLGNISLLLVTMIGVQAQEIWALLLTWVVTIGNIVLLATLGFTPAIITILAAGLAAATVTRDVRAFRLNPVMLKELRERMRGARAFVVITVYLGLMSGFTVLVYLLQRGVVQTGGSSVTGELGRTLFEGVFGLELLLIIFIAPAFTAGSVSNERERKTYDLLQITLLPKPSFVIGKLESALSYIFLLLLAAIPLQSIAFLFGGVSQTELVLAFVILGITAIALGTVGMYFSTTVERTLTASVRSYTVAFITTIGVPIVLWFFVSAFNSAVSGTAANVAKSTVVEAIIMYIGALVVSLNPVFTASATQQLLINKQEMGFWTATLSNGDKIPMVSPWISFTIIYLVISTVLIVLAVREMRRADM